MTEEQFTKAQELFEIQWMLEKGIENAKLAQDWESLILNFRHVDKPDFLGAFDIVRERFINEVQRDLDEVNKKIEAI